MSHEPGFPSSLPPPSLAVDSAFADADMSPTSVTPLTPVVPGLPADLARLFRHSLREGRVHPLMPLLLRYRLAPRPDAKGEGP